MISINKKINIIDRSEILTHTRFFLLFTNEEFRVTANIVNSLLIKISRGKGEIYIPFKYKHITHLKDRNSEACGLVNYLKELI